MIQTKFNKKSLEDFKKYALEKNIDKDFIKDIPTTNN